MSKASIPRQIINNRREKISDFVAEYNLTPAILAEYFQVPLKVIDKDIKEAKVTLSKHGLDLFDMNGEKT